MKFPPEKFNSVQAHSLIAELDAALLEPTANPESIA